MKRGGPPGGGGLSYFLIFKNLPVKSHKDYSFDVWCVTYSQGGFSRRHMGFILSYKPRLLFSRAGYASCGLSLHQVNIGKL